MSYNSKFDKPAFRTLNAESTKPLLFVCEHASNYIPKEFNSLGLEQELLKEHIAWDPGTAELTQHLAQEFSATAVLCQYSRLLIDCNRPLDNASSILPISEKHFVPGNENLSHSDIVERQDGIFKPFHQELEKHVKKIKAHHEQFPIFGVHSFTPSFLGVAREFHFAVLWKNETPYINSILDYLMQHELSDYIGFNEPYSAKEISAHTTEYHADKNNLPNLIFEVRQDLLESSDGIRYWGNFIKEVINAAKV